MAALEVVSVSGQTGYRAKLNLLDSKGGGLVSPFFFILVFLNSVSVCIAWLRN